MPKIILASSSVQRKRLLEKAGFSFEVIVSNVDETPVEAYSFNDQFKDISMRKALAVIDMVSSDEDYIIVAADQNIFFNGTMYGKPNNIEEARELIKSMQGSNQIYAFVGNTVLYVSNSKVIEFINECDIARLRMDSCISNQELENYLSTKSPLDKCAGINVFDAPFLHLEEGKMSTACGMTIEYLIEMLTKI